MKKLFTLIIVTTLALNACYNSTTLNAAVPTIDFSSLRKNQQQYDEDDIRGEDNIGRCVDSNSDVSEKQESEQSSSYEPTPNDLLLQAVQDNNLSEVRRLLNPNQATPDCYLIENKQTPLHIAVQNRQYPFVQIIITLLNYGADPNARDINGQTPLHIAIELQNIPAVTILLKRGAKPDIPDYFGQTSLDIARSHPQKIKVNAVYFDQHIRETALHIAARIKDSSEAINALLSLGLDPNAQNVFKQTPLHIAAVHGNYDAVEALLNGNADPTIVDRCKKTPAQVAKTLEILKLLEKAQAFWP